MSLWAGASGVLLAGVVVAVLLVPRQAPAQVGEPPPGQDGAGPPFTLELVAERGGGQGKPTVIRARLTRMLRDETPLIFRVELPDGADLVAGFPEEKVVNPTAHTVERVYVVQSHVAAPGAVRVSVRATSEAWGATATQEYRWGEPEARVDPPTVKGGRVPGPGGRWSTGIPIVGEGVE